MHKTKKVLVLMAVGVLLVACDTKTQPNVSVIGPGSNDSPISSSVEIGEITQMPEKAIIHYKNAEESYDDYCFWFWSDSVVLEQETYAEGTDDFGMYVTIDVATYIKRESDISFSFLVKEKDSWGYQTSDVEVFIGNFDVISVEGVWTMHVYALALTKNDIQLSRTAEDGNKDFIRTARFDKTGSKIELECTGPLQSFKVYAFDKGYYLSEKPNDESYVIFEKPAGGGATASVSESLGSSFKFDSNKVYRVVGKFTSDPTYEAKRVVDLSNLYGTSLFANKVYDGDDMGLTFAKDGTPVFKVFAPTAALVQVLIYKHPNPSTYHILFPHQKPEYDDPAYTINLNILDNGIHTSETVTTGDWASEETRKLVADGTYYYTLCSYTSKGKKEILDPYATTTGVDSIRALIAPMDHEDLTPAAFAALPEVWDKHPTYDIDSPLDLVISENHIRDLTMSDTWTSDPEARALEGTYKGFSLEGTTYTKGQTTVKTGFDHLEEYGVNAIQLLPIFDQDNDDRKPTFNWGYNPLNYNVPEGSYSSNPFDAYARVYELRELIAKFANNDNHTRIIMDVVYNHVSKATSSNFDFLAPGYYFRQDENGELLDNSGCGNEFKSEAPMARKFIVDSVCQWAKNYLIKGFRFDLMGLIDVQTMKEVKEALYEIDPDIVVYGEGWDATGAYYSNDSFASTTQVYAQLYSSGTSPGYVGGFNDAGRNAIRGENNGGNDYPGYGFISQGSSDLSRDKVNAVADMMKGNHTGKGGNPLQTVNYASCHDNYTLFDQLNWTLSDDGGTTAPRVQDVAKASVAVNGMIMMSNGIAFVNGGEELFRSKIETDETSKYAVNMYGKLISHNSYKSSDETNAYDYSRKVDLLDYFNMYKALVAIRKNLKLIPYPDNNEPSIQDTWDTSSGTTISVFREGKDNTNYYFFFNGRSASSSFNFGPGDQIFNNGSTFTRTDTGLSVDSPYALGIYSYGRS